MSVMEAYNKVNGTYCCENSMLLYDVLRDKWSFEGFTLSDFFYGIYDCAKSIKSGMDVELSDMLYSPIISKRGILPKGI